MIINNYKKQESGRSMIEMLGVLAIIGVLSVGGIAGYSKAMNKYKVNAVADQMAMIVTNIRTLYAQQRDYNSLTTDIAIKMGVIPDDIIEVSSDGKKSVVNSYGGGVHIIASDLKDSGDDKAFIVEYNGISRDACVNLSTSDWGTGANTGLIAVAAGFSAKEDAKGHESSALLDTDKAYVNCAGDAAFGCQGGSNTGLPLSVAKAAAACDCDNDSCNFAVKYY